MVSYQTRRSKARSSASVGQEDAAHLQHETSEEAGDGDDFDPNVIATSATAAPTSSVPTPAPTSTPASLPPRAPSSLSSSSAIGSLALHNSRRCELSCWPFLAARLTMWRSTPADLPLARTGPSLRRLLRRLHNIVMPPFARGKLRLSLARAMDDSQTHSRRPSSPARQTAF